MEKNCKRCGVAFTPKNPKGKFCSDKCRVYFSREKVAVIEYNPPAIFSSKENIDKLNAAFREEGFRPKTLDQLKAMCPPELTGFERSAWIATERQKYSI